MPINRITPKIPIEMNDDGVYEYLYSDDLTAVIDQNLKMILLTRKGERMMSPAFGAGVHDFLFENPTNQVLTTIKNIISNQIRLYATYITVNDIQIVYSGESSINISIRYTIDENSTSAVFETTVI